MYGKSSLVDLIITFCLNVPEIQNERKKLFFFSYQVKEVLWNTDSTVLAVWCEDLLTDENTDNCKKSYGKELLTKGYFVYYSTEA